MCRAVPPTRCQSITTDATEAITVLNLVIAERGGRGLSENAREQFVTVEPATEGIHVYSTLPPADGDYAMVVIPWDRAVEVSHRMLELAQNHGDVK